MTTATAVPQPEANGTLGVGLYGRPRPRCEHIDPDTGDRCITRLRTGNPGPVCHAHAHLRARMQADSVERVMREREAVAA